jgi:Subtilase family
MADTPSVGAVRCYTGGGFYSTNFLSCQTGFSHGTAVAEAFHDMAPNATFYLATYITKGDLQAAVQWMVQQGVRVINISQSLEWDGPGDGTSPYSDSPLKAVDAAVAGGAVVTISTGNHGNKAWFGPWQDRNADGRLEFDSSLNDLSCVFADASELVTVELRWQDSWGGATRDLDLELYDWYRGIKVDELRCASRPRG